MLKIHSSTLLLILLSNLVGYGVSAQDLAQRQPLKPLSNSSNSDSVNVNGDYPVSTPSDNLAQRFPYTLDAGDVIALNIFNVPEYSREYQVLVDGTLNLPLINRVSVAGLTLAEAELLISQKYVSQGILRDPIVSVDLVNPRPINIAMVGEIRTPGSYSIPFETGGTTTTNTIGGKRFPTLIKALQLANGINASADIRNIQVIRNFKGRDYFISVNLWDFLENGDLRQNIVLRDGDRILVKSSEKLDPTEVLRVATANFSANLSLPISVSIVGEVNRPGPYTLAGDDVKATNLTDQLSFDNNRVISNQQSLAGIPTATRAIKIAGGLTAKADIRNIEVRRTLPSGEEQIIKVNLWQLLQTGKFTDDALLQNGDRIFIPTAEAIDESEVRQIAVASFSPNTINVSVIGEVKDPGLKQLPPNVSLQQALLRAGGFNNRRANESTVKLIRLNPNGTVTEKVVKVNFAAPLDQENNPPLLNNDIVFVDRSGFAMASDATAQVLDPFAQIISIIANTARLVDIFNNN